MQRRLTTAVTMHLCVRVVASPVWPDAGLPAKIPNLELDVFVGHRLNIEADSCTRAWQVCEPMLATGQISRLHTAMRIMTAYLGSSTPPRRLAIDLRGRPVARCQAQAHAGEDGGPGMGRGKGRSHRMVVFPALSRPSTRILASFSPKRLNSLDIHIPIDLDYGDDD